MVLACLARIRRRQPGYTAIEVSIKRSMTTIAVAIFVMVMLLAMSLAILFLTLAIVLGGWRLDPPIVALPGALLFGFVAFRNVLPGVPPLGAQSD